MIRRSSVILALCALAVCGCVERELNITTEPAGGVVQVNGVDVGRTGETPIKVPFTWYGDYDIVIRMDGYQTLKTHANINMPWYEVPPADFFSEIAPWTYQDKRYLHFKLVKQPQPSDAELMDRADKLKARNLEPVTP